MPTPQELDAAWKSGFVEGYQQARITSHKPSIPPRPASVPPGTADQIKFFYNEGEKAGYEKGIKDNAGLQSP